MRRKRFGIMAVFVLLMIPAAYAPSVVSASDALHIGLQSPITGSVQITSTSAVALAPAASEGAPTERGRDTTIPVSDWSSLLAALVGAVFGGLFVMLGDWIRAFREDRRARVTNRARALALVDRAIAGTVHAVALGRDIDLSLFDPIFLDPGQLYAEVVRAEWDKAVMGLWDSAVAYNHSREVSPDVQASEVRAAARDLARLVRPDEEPRG